VRCEPWRRCTRSLSLILLLIALFGANPAGSGPDLVFIESFEDGVDFVDYLWGTVDVTVSPDGRHVYVAGQYDKALNVFARDAMLGELTFNEALLDDLYGVDGLDNVRNVTLSPDGRHLYAAGNNDDSVATFSRESDNGALSFTQVIKDGDNAGFVDGLDGAQDVAVSGDGKHVYVASTVDSAVAVFSRNASSGELTYLEVHKNGVAGVWGLGGAMSLALSPDGKNVYATGAYDDSVVVFGRDGSTGLLTFFEVKQDGSADVDGLSGATGVVVSPDGKHLYATGCKDDAVAIFERDPTTGVLTYLSAVFDDVGGVDGLDGAELAALSPDGQSLYVSGMIEDELAVFARDRSSGALRFLGVYADGVDGVDGLDGAWSIAVSPDGSSVYVTGFYEPGLAVFRAKRLGIFEADPPESAEKPAPGF
jgi:6-phosphogluconolactonase (cycloisomerase 2 family)